MEENESPQTMVKLLREIDFFWESRTLSKEKLDVVAERIRRADPIPGGQTYEELTQFDVEGCDFNGTDKRRN